MAKNFTVEMTQEKTTKNTAVYVAEGGAITQLYIQKSAFEGDPPQSVKVVVTEA